VNALDSLVTALRRLPGVGKRAAQKMALHALLDRESVLAPLQAALAEAQAAIKTCTQCGNLDVTEPCAVCADEGRDQDVLCVVPHVGELWALERTQLFKGRYHVLGGLLSAINGVGPESLRIDELLSRVHTTPDLQEIIFALPTSVEGQSTVHHLMHLMEQTAPHIAFTRLAQGMPMGGHLDTMDEGTLALALNGRARV
jgi:recombination protein RecR